jgi:hypothetical protein
MIFFDIMQISESINILMSSVVYTGSSLSRTTSPASRLSKRECAHAPNLTAILSSVKKEICDTIKINDLILLMKSFFMRKEYIKT